MQEAFHTWEEKKLGQPLRWNWGCQKKIYIYGISPATLSVFERQNSNDSDAIQPHKNKTDTENDEKVYKVAYRIPDRRMFQWMHH